MKKENNENEALNKTDVSSSTLISNVPIKFAECVKKYHKEFNVKLKSIKDYHNKWKTVHVVGKMSDLVLLNEKCEKETYGDLDDVE
jgi:hypothetical protein